MTLDELAYEYGWEHWGNKYIREKAEYSIVIDLHLNLCYIQAAGREIDLLSGLKVGKIKQIIKLFGVKL